MKSRRWRIASRMDWRWTKQKLKSEWCHSGIESKRTIWISCLTLFWKKWEATTFKVSVHTNNILTPLRKNVACIIWILGLDFYEKKASNVYYESALFRIKTFLTFFKCSWIDKTIFHLHIITIKSFSFTYHSMHSWSLSFYVCLYSNEIKSILPPFLLQIRRRFLWPRKHMKILLRIVKQVLQLRNLFKRQCQLSALHFERARKSNLRFM